MASAELLNRRAVLGVADGVEGTRQTLAIMRKLAREAQLDDDIRQQAENIVAGIPGHAFMQEAKSVHAWMRDNIRYTRDPDGIERVCGAQYTLLHRQGDCDDMAILEAALLVAIGHPVRFVAVAFQPDFFSHVYIETLIGDQWLPSDPTTDEPFGWEPPGILSRLYRGV